MTGWIKMGTGLASHPKVKALRRALKADRLKVIGGLWAVWCVFDEHSASGRLDGYTLDDMDEEIGWRGFSEAMRDIGWLQEDADGLEAPDYEEHNGPNAKRRALDASRKGRSRAQKPDDEPPPDPQDERTSIRKQSGHVSASDADNLRNREEKRREEEKTETPPLTSVGSDGAGNEPGTREPTPYAAVCIALKAAGVAQVNPSNQLLRALVDAGATPAEFTAAAAKAIGKGDPFAYVLGVVEGERKRAAATASQLHRGAMPGTQEALPWHESVKGIVAKGEELGCGTWSQADWEAGRLPAWPAYRARVFRAAGFDPRDAKEAA